MSNKGPDSPEDKGKKEPGVFKQVTNTVTNAVTGGMKALGEANKPKEQTEFDPSNLESSNPEPQPKKSKIGRRLANEQRVPVLPQVNVEDEYKAFIKRIESLAASNDSQKDGLQKLKQEVQDQHEALKAISSDKKSNKEKDSKERYAEFRKFITQKRKELEKIEQIIVQETKAKESQKDAQLAKDKASEKEDKDKIVFIQQQQLQAKQQTEQLNQDNKPITESVKDTYQEPAEFMLARKGKIEEDITILQKGRTNLGEELQAIEKKLNSVKTQLKTVTDKIDENQTQETAAKQGLAKATQDHLNASDKVKDEQSKISQLQKDIESKENVIKAKAKELSHLTEQLKEVQAKQVPDGPDKAEHEKEKQTEVDRLKKEIEVRTKEKEELGFDLEKSQLALKQANEKIKPLVAEEHRHKEEIKKHEEQLKKLQDEATTLKEEQRKLTLEEQLVGTELSTKQLEISKVNSKIQDLTSLKDSYVTLEQLYKDEKKLEENIPILEEEAKIQQEIVKKQQAEIDKIESKIKNLDKNVIIKRQSELKVLEDNDEKIDKALREVEDHIRDSKLKADSNRKPATDRVNEVEVAEREKAAYAELKAAKEQLEKDQEAYENFNKYTENKKDKDAISKGKDKADKLLDASQKRVDDANRVLFEVQLDKKDLLVAQKTQNAGLIDTKRGILFNANEARTKLQEDQSKISDELKQSQTKLKQTTEALDNARNALSANQDEAQKIREKIALSDPESIAKLEENLALSTANELGDKGKKSLEQENVAEKRAKLTGDIEALKLQREAQVAKIASLSKQKETASPSQQQDLDKEIEDATKKADKLQQDIAKKEEELKKTQAQSQKKEEQKPKPDEKPKTEPPKLSAMRPKDSYDRYVKTTPKAGDTTKSFADNAPDMANKDGPELFGAWLAWLFMMLFALFGELGFKAARDKAEKDLNNMEPMLRNMGKLVDKKKALEDKIEKYKQKHPEPRNSVEEAKLAKMQKKLDGYIEGLKTHEKNLQRIVQSKGKRNTDNIDEAQKKVDAAKAVKEQAEKDALNAKERIEKQELKLEENEKAQEQTKEEIETLEADLLEAKKELKQAEQASREYAPKIQEKNDAARNAEIALMQNKDPAKQEELEKNVIAARDDEWNTRLQDPKYLKDREIHELQVRKDNAEHNIKVLEAKHEKILDKIAQAQEDEVVAKKQVEEAQKPFDEAMEDLEKAKAKQDKLLAQEQRIGLGLKSQTATLNLTSPPEGEITPDANKDKDKDKDKNENLDIDSVELTPQAELEQISKDLVATEQLTAQLSESASTLDNKDAILNDINNLNNEVKKQTEKLRGISKDKLTANDEEAKKEFASVKAFVTKKNNALLKIEEAIVQEEIKKEVEKQNALDKTDDKTKEDEKQQNIIAQQQLQQEQRAQLVQERPLTEEDAKKEEKEKKEKSLKIKSKHVKNRLAQLKAGTKVRARREAAYSLLLKDPESRKTLNFMMIGLERKAKRELKAQRDYTRLDQLVNQQQATMAMQDKIDAELKVAKEKGNKEDVEKLEKEKDAAAKYIAQSERVSLKLEHEIAVNDQEMKKILQDEGRFDEKLFKEAEHSVAVNDEDVKQRLIVDKRFDQAMFDEAQKAQKPITLDEKPPEVPLSPNPENTEQTVVVNVTPSPELKPVPGTAEDEAMQATLKAEETQKDKVKAEEEALESEEENQTNQIAANVGDPNIAVQIKNAEEAQKFEQQKLDAKDKKAENTEKLEISPQEQELEPEPEQLSASDTVQTNSYDSMDDLFNTLRSTQEEVNEETNKVKEQANEGVSGQINGEDVGASALNVGSSQKSYLTSYTPVPAYTKTDYTQTTRPRSASTPQFNASTSMQASQDNDVDNPEKTESRKRKLSQ
ncbi:MAG: hypothetical protein JSS07_03390 [Proteobacteria bacterium]|nr:hypothetical protein [Pseudomonadota bacterium]